MILSGTVRNEDLATIDQRLKSPGPVSVVVAGHTDLASDIDVKYIDDIAKLTEIARPNKQAPENQGKSQTGETANRQDELDKLLAELKKLVKQDKKGDLDKLLVKLNKLVKLDEQEAGQPAVSPADRGQLVVSLAQPGESGTGGTLLLLLARVRFAVPDATLTPLDQGIAARLGERAKSKSLAELKAADPGNLISPDSATWPFIFGGLSATVIIALLFVHRRSSERPPHTSGRSLKARPNPHATGPATGTSRSTRGRPTPPQPPSPRLRPRPRPRPIIKRGPLPDGTGIVRTDLDPEGYVEVDGVLRRAVWRGAGDRPDIGRQVRLSSTDGHLLIATR
ncbi:hypothetical protein Mth01_45740 [Sphaerimonospora thailandensis]|uniref:Uncharacterized protein n=2 Tax=Sphaerimonospora thailandensis TaxID=795644 RepID=A0A8J3RDM2_9ACTN|nr:hypothetical protein Mth01_45740 [Sphaerimonospora thailandensis]